MDVGRAALQCSVQPSVPEDVAEKLLLQAAGRSGLVAGKTTRLQSGGCTVLHAPGPEHSSVDGWLILGVEGALFVSFTAERGTAQLRQRAQKVFGSVRSVAEAVPVEVLDEARKLLGRLMPNKPITQRGRFLLVPVGTAQNGWSLKRVLALYAKNDPSWPEAIEKEAVAFLIKCVALEGVLPPSA